MSARKPFNCDDNKGEHVIPVRKGKCEGKVNFIRDEVFHNEYCVKNECMEKQDIQIARLMYMNPETTPDTRKRIMPLRNPGDFQSPFTQELITNEEVTNAGIGDPTQDIDLSDPDAPIEMYIEKYREELDRRAEQPITSRYKSLVATRDARKQAAASARTRHAEKEAAKRRARQEERRNVLLARNKSHTRSGPSIRPQKTPFRRHRLINLPEGMAVGGTRKFNVDTFYKKRMKHISPITGKPLYPRSRRH